MKNAAAEKLVFIYNADSGLGNTLVDGAHKIFSPSTYECSLCSLTFGAFIEKTAWKKFREEGAFEMEFLHKDEFHQKYASKFGHKFTFPIVLAETKTSLEVVVNTESLNDLEKIDDLIALIMARA